MRRLRVGLGALTAPRARPGLGVCPGLHHRRRQRRVRRRAARRHRRSVEPGAHRKDAAPRSPTARAVYRIVDLRPGTYSVTFTLTGFTHGQARRRRADRLVRRHDQRRAEGRRGRGNDHGHRRNAGRRRAEREARDGAQRATSSQTLPATRAYGALLNAMPGLTVDTNGAAPTTPTMTFFTARGGRTNEGRMTINGMTVAAPFNGGGVSSLDLRHGQRRGSRGGSSPAAWARPTSAGR